MADTVNQKEINDVLWRACDTFRGVIDASQYKDYILVMLFLKYLSDLWTDLKDEMERKYKGDKHRVERALARERFVVPKESHFSHLYSKRREANIGDLINMALADIEDKNLGKLEGVFRNIDFNSKANLGKPKDRNARLVHFVVIDLKMQKFTPEDAGKLNFYLSAVDSQFRHPDDKPSIGLVLCKTRDRVIAEYARRDISKPIGVAEWQTQLVHSLPEPLRSNLPTIEQIEEELRDLKPRDEKGDA